MKASERAPAGARRRSLSEAMRVSPSGGAPGGLPAAAEPKKKITLNVPAETHIALRYHALDKRLSLEAFIVGELVAIGARKRPADGGG
jgi:hypothetical protein